jgi:hypothetical protein
MTTYRVLVSTDLGGDPDDIQSLVHLLHYSDVLRLEGLISTSGPGADPQAELIREWVRRTDLDHLRSRGHPELMSEVQVLGLVAQGQRHAQPPGPGKATEGSRLIVECALAGDPEGAGRPLWVLVWGSLTDVAQALHDEPAIADRIRINAIGSSNTTNDPASRDFIYEGMERQWPGLWWIEDGILPKFSHETFRGYYLGGFQEGMWGSAAYLEQVIRGRGTDHGSLFAERLGDAFPKARHPGQGQGILKEGDSPTFLYLLSPVFGEVGDVEDPTQPGWGGQFRRPDRERFPGYYTDLDAPPGECQATINRWRRDYLEHWRSRWGWY